MDKFILTAEEITLIERHLAGKYSPFFAPKEEQELFNTLIEKAEALEDELDAIDERMSEPNCDLLSWYYKKYKAQE